MNDYQVVLTHPPKKKIYLAFPDFFVLHKSMKRASVKETAGKDFLRR